MKLFAIKRDISIIYGLCKIALILLFALPANGQKVVDKMVATVSDGVQSELITYSDLLWQLAMGPDVSIDPPSSNDLNRALQIIIRQRLIALEAKRLPRADPKPEEIDAEIKRILDQFPTTGSFVERLNLVGFGSVNDENFQQMIEDRVAIEKYVEFRFRSFVVVTPEDERDYYRNEFTPQFRRDYPERLLPPLEQVRERIIEILTERRVKSDIENFLDGARARAEIIILDDV